MRHSRSKRTGGAAQFAVIATGIVSILAVGAFLILKKPAAPPLDEARTITDPFLANIRSGQVDAAWTSTANDFKSYLGREGFRRFVARQPALKQPLNYVDCQSLEFAGSTKWQCNYRSAPKPPQKLDEVRLLLTLEEGNWKVERCEVNPRPTPAIKQ